MPTKKAAVLPTGIIRDWTGTVQQGGMEFRVLVHIRQAANGTLKGAMDNPDAGRIGIPLAEIAMRNNTLRFEAPTIDGVYRGKTRGDGVTIAGTWKMGEIASRVLLYPVKPSRVDGIWTGTLSLPTIRLRLLFYIGNGRDGLIVTMKSPDQSEQMIAMNSAVLVGSKLTLGATEIAAQFEGELGRASTAIKGKWSQGGHTWALNLTRIAREEGPKPNRPQEPTPPYPYREEEVRYRKRGMAFELAGTLTVPKGNGPFPAVFLIAGSGALDRDETMYDHRPFLILADRLARRGIAVLRADKRGVGDSGGDGATATTEDFSIDAAAGFAYLSKRPEIDRDRIGVIGHSEGGLIACMLAARNRNLAFIVLMAAPGVPGWKLAGQQARRQAETYGLDPDDAERQATEMTALLRTVKSQPVLRRKLGQMFEQLSEDRRTAKIDYLMLPWQRHFATIDPARYLRRVKCPVLALNGEMDAAVECKSNLMAIRQALEAGGNVNTQVWALPELNHLFQTCNTGSETEYWHIEETLAPVFLEKVLRWIAKSARGR